MHSWYDFSVSQASRKAYGILIAFVGSYYYLTTNYDNPNALLETPVWYSSFSSALLASDRSRLERTSGL